MLKSVRDYLIRNKRRLRFLKPLWVGYRICLGILPWRWLPVSSRWLGPPKGFHARTCDYLKSGAADDLDRAVVVGPASEVIRSVPRMIDGGPPAKFETGLRQKIPAEEVFILHGVRFWGDYAGTIIGRDDRVLGDLTRDVWEVRRHKIFTRIKLPRCRQLQGVTAILSAAEAEGNYWHWTLEVLPRLEQLARAGFPIEKVDWFVVNHRNRTYQRETLEAAGVPWDKVVQADAALHVECECALAPRLKDDQFGVSAATTAFLNAQAAARWPEARPFRRLFISRRRASFRRLVNEEAVYRRLQERGFERIDCEDHSVAEQQRLFREAAVVVGPHGSAFTNTVYAQPGTQVLEFFSPGYIDQAFWCFADQLGLEHWMICGVGKQPPAGKELVGRQDDITVDPAQVEATLDAMNVTR